MKKILFAILSLVTITIGAQNVTNWTEVLLQPDLLVHFPNEPLVIVNDDKQTYQCDTGDVTLKITVEKNPLNYKGKSTEEVDKAYYGNLNQSILNNNQTLIKESNFDFEGHHVRELIYYDTINTKPCKITLQILNVIGLGEAMYKFYLIDFGFQNQNSTNYNEFFQNWNLYYSMENKIDMDKTKYKKALKEKGFIIDNDRKKKKR